MISHERFQRRKLPKRSGGFRTIVAPDPESKEDLRAFVPALEGAAMLLDKHGVQHGFTPARSPVTNAMAHRGYQWTLSMDLSDCFDHVTYHMVQSVLPGVTSLLFDHGVAAQGLPTSPALCNIALAEMDDLLVGVAGNFDFTYTRYADDLTFSGNCRKPIRGLQYYAEQVIRDCGQVPNSKKTRIQWAGAGRRIITGVAVDDDVHPTRRLRRRLRAALHQENYHEARGLLEWSKLKVPSRERAAAKRWAVLTQAGRGGPSEDFLRMEAIKKLLSG